MAGYWPRSFFCEFMDLDFVSVHKHAKKELGQYPAILTEQTWSITHTSNNKLSDNNLASELVENRTFFKPITSEEIVLFMINEEKR